VPEEDRINVAFKAQEEKQAKEKNAKLFKRKIQYQRFSNISSAKAIADL